MDITNEMLELMVIVILAIADVVLLSIVAYSIYLFRKDTYNFEKLVRNQFKTNTNEKANH